MALEPILTFWNRDTDTNLETDPNGWSVGIVKATESSNVLNLRLWNNKGGDEDASYMQDCTLFILDANQGKTLPVVTGGWLKAKCSSLNHLNFVELNNVSVLAVGSSELTGDQIAGELNDGLDTNSTHFADVELKFEIPYQAPHGNHDFHVAVRYFYT